VREVLAASLLLLALPGCATTGSSRGSLNKDGWFAQNVDLEGPDGRGSVRVLYTAAHPKGWQAGMTPPGDFAFYNPALGASLYADTSCGKRYQDAKLTVLANHLVMGFADLHDVDEQELMLDGRAALERTASGTLDGVPVALGLTVLKNGPCVFDLVYIGHPDHRDEGLTAFRAFRDGFQARFDP
jgi:hypothetical protein